MLSPIRQLAELYKDGGHHQQFTTDYAGDYLPARLPHAAVWSKANGHWLRYNSDIMRTTAVAGLSGAAKLSRAERYSVYVLWALALLHNCPNCAMSALVGPDELDEILKEAEDV